MNKEEKKKLLKAMEGVRDIYDDDLWEAWSDASSGQL